MILVVYYSCTLTVKLRLWLTKYRRNRISFASLVRPAILILKGQWGWFWRKLQPWGFLYLLTCPLGLLYLLRTLFVGDALFHFQFLPLFLLLGLLPKRHMRGHYGFSDLIVLLAFLTPYSFSVTFFTLWPSPLIILLQINETYFWCKSHNKAPSVVTLCSLSDT